MADRPTETASTETASSNSVPIPSATSAEITTSSIDTTPVAVAPLPVVVEPAAPKEDLPQAVVAEEKMGQDIDPTSTPPAPEPQSEPESTLTTLSTTKEESEAEDVLMELETPNTRKNKGEEKFISGNKSRHGGRDTQFYQVLNVSSVWHRNYSLSIKENARIKHVSELLEEKLATKRTVYVQFGEDLELLSLDCHMGDKFSQLKGKISELSKVRIEDFDITSGNHVLSNDDIVSSLQEKSNNKLFPKPYVGVVFVVPR